MAETDVATSTGSKSAGKRKKQGKSGGQPRGGNGNPKGRTGLLDLLDENPLKVGAATLALGFVAGLALPLTRKENELMGDTRERLLERAREAGQEVLDKGQQIVVQAVANVREGVQEAVASLDQQVSKGTAKPSKKTAGKRGGLRVD